MEKDRLTGKYSVIAIGGSAGSLEVILHILQAITTHSLAIIVVLHRKNAIDSLLADVMGYRSVLQVKEAEEKESIEPGTVYVAPADYHLLVESDHTISLDYSEKVNFSRPSIDVTFQSVAQAYREKVVGILLSGGNTDGTAGLSSIKAAGGLCIVQDPRSAEIAFMPEYATHHAAVDRVLKSDEIAPFINSLG